MIELTDNQRGKEISMSEIEDFLPLANKDIRKLCEENERLLVFPHSLDMSNDKIEYNPLFVVEDYKKESLKVKTGNIMGFIGANGKRMRIRSRFDKDGDKDFFLHYMLQKVFSFNIFNLDFTSSEDNVFEFLVYMFPAMLKKAMRQGVYKEYRRFRHNNANVRGTIDISRHIRENIPFRGTVAYNTREFCFDNSITELIRHTIEYIKTLPSGDIILSSDKTVEDCIKKIISYTPSYSHTERIKIIQDNLLPCNHPFYTEYTALQKLCVQILRQEEIKYGTDDDRIYGILFDGAWLWEEYLNILLCEKGFIHPENKLGTGAIYLFEHGGQRFPDFWKQDIVLDAKYKKLAINGNRLDIERDDVHQIMAYMYRLKASKGGIVCPYDGEKNKIISQNMHKDSYLGSLSLYALAIPKNCSSYGDFTKRIVENERTLLEELS